jgi:CO dehydrogenase nickel-insertion accessory protein CooC1
VTEPLLVAACLSNRAWRARLQSHVRDHEADMVVELVRDRHQALADRVEVVLIDDDTSWISAPVVASLHRAGKCVVGVFDPDESDGFGKHFLHEAGVELRVPSDLSTDALVSLLRQHRPLRAMTVADRVVIASTPETTPKDRRPVLAVGGPSGAGGTEVAVGMAQLLAGEPTVLLEVDESHPGLARRLGLSVHPHIVTAVHALQRASTPGFEAADPTVEECTARPSLGQPDLGFHVITGLVSRDDWSLLRGDEVVDLIDHLTGRGSHVIAKVGSTLEEIPNTPRYEVSRQVITRADRIVGVADGSPTGLLHFADWLADAVALAGDTPIDVVVNRTPPWTACGSQLREAVREIAGEHLHSVTLVPPDRRVTRAGWDATTIAVGPFLRRLSTLGGVPPAGGRWTDRFRNERHPTIETVAS